MADLLWHVEALDDLENVGAFIARESPEYAPEFLERIVEAAERLAAFPRLGRVVPEIRDETYRELIFQNYRIVYRVLVDRVAIIGVVHAAMHFAAEARRRGWNIT